MIESGTGWEEDESASFIRYGDIITPSRDEQIEILTSLIPAEHEDRFEVADLACGAGWLSKGILERFPQARVRALDGSPAMLREAQTVLSSHLERVAFTQFDLRARDWLEPLDGVRAFVSSLAIHHLDATEKGELFRDLRAHLAPGGALLIADLVDSINERVQSAYAAAWDAVVEKQARGAVEGEAALLFFKEGWNLYRFPDPEFDKPSLLFEQLQWLSEAGYSGVDCFWLRAGHAIYGGYR